MPGRHDASKRWPRPPKRSERRRLGRGVRGTGPRALEPHNRRGYPSICRVFLGRAPRISDSPCHSRPSTPPPHDRCGNEFAVSPLQPPHRVCVPSSWVRNASQRSAATGTAWDPLACIEARHPISSLKLSMLGDADPDQLCGATYAETFHACGRAPSSRGRQLGCVYV